MRHPSSAAPAWLTMTRACAPAPAARKVPPSRAATLSFAVNPGRSSVLTVTRDMILPTTVTDSYPRPLWFDRSLAGRRSRRCWAIRCSASSISTRLPPSSRAGSRGPRHRDRPRRPLRSHGGRQVVVLPIERLCGIDSHRDTSRGWNEARAPCWSAARAKPGLTAATKRPILSAFEGERSDKRSAMDASVQDRTVGPIAFWL
jgi:hypothetical protein